MTERSRFWNGTTVGDATEAAYDAPTEFAQAMSAFSSAAGQANQSRIVRSAGTSGVLQVFSPGANTIRVAQGEAIVYGAWYANDGVVDTNIPTPGGATRIDRIVLRKSWAAQTVRVTRIAGAEGGAAPAIVQTVGVTWDFPLARISITTGGVMTIIHDVTGILRNFFLPLAYKNASVAVVTDGTHGIPVHKLANAVTDFADGLSPLPEDYIYDTLLTVKIRWSMEASTTGNAVVACTVTRLTDGAVPATEILTAAAALTTVAVPGTIRMTKETVFTTTLPAFAGDWLRVRIERQGAHANDTTTGDMNMYATVEVEYQAFE